MNRGTRLMTLAVAVALLWGTEEATAAADPVAAIAARAVAIGSAKDPLARAQEYERIAALVAARIAAHAVRADRAAGVRQLVEAYRGVLSRGVVREIESMPGPDAVLRKRIGALLARCALHAEPLAGAVRGAQPKAREALWLAVNASMRLRSRIRAYLSGKRTTVAGAQKDSSPPRPGKPAAPPAAKTEYRTIRQKARDRLRKASERWKRE